ncbi:MAG: nif-specific transcriptional activator NifA [Alphaproteobacteria bacterium]|jgi:Nif-specific regulatory protein|nr:nif-specific transcriptional activator NifA [Alphaproteobacteria bacterium]
MFGYDANSASLSLISIYEISKILSSSLELQGVLRDVLNLLSSYLQMRHGLVALQGDGEILTVVAAAGMSPRAVASGAATLPRLAAERILSSEIPLVVQDIAEDPLLAEHNSPSDLAEGERACFMGVPIKTLGRPFGVLTVERVWSPEMTINFGSDVRFLSMVANLIGQTASLHNTVAKDRQAIMDRAHRGQKASNLYRPATVPYTMEGVVGNSRAMQEVFAQVHQVAPTKSTVLLRGESGTGKELIARAIHVMSRRRDRAFVKVNCAALPESLLESELFGHEKGAFTGATQDRRGRFELADQGTLFLDEIGEISRAFQAKLLRVLQEGEFERVGGMKTVKADVRIIAATNKHLEEAVSKGEFRSDLYYRINVVPIFLPPLRERREDIPPLAESFLRRFNEENERQVRFSEEAMELLMGCSFPGNVRELENCVYRTATMSKGDVIVDINLPCQTDHCLSKSLWTPELANSPAPPVIPETDVATGLPDRGGGGEGDDDDDLATLPKRERLVRAMEKAGWVQAKAARLLGLTPRQLGYALRKYKIEIKRL